MPAVKRREALAAIVHAGHRRDPQMAEAAFVASRIGTAAFYRAYDRGAAASENHQPCPCANCAGQSGDTATEQAHTNTLAQEAIEVRQAFEKTEAAHGADAPEVAALRHEIHEAAESDAVLQTLHGEIGQDGELHPR